MKEKVFRFRAVEKRIAASHPGFRVLDVGCGKGDNLRRLKRYGGKPFGIEPNATRALEATEIAPAIAAAGEMIPLASESFEMVYISHVHHHATDIDAVLGECYRVLVPGGLLFVIETIDDSPLMRLARAVQPSWDDDAVLNRFHYSDLVAAFEKNGFAVKQGEKFNWMYFAWEILPLAVRPLEFFTPLFIGLEILFHHPLGTRWGGHCWLVASKPGPPVFPEDCWCP